MRLARLCPRLRPRLAGFTLIEVMVVLVIMGVVATGISVGLDSLRGRDVDQALRRLRLVLEASADRALVRGMIEESAAAYAKEKGIKPRDCSKEG